MPADASFRHCRALVCGRDWDEPLCGVLQTTCTAWNYQASGQTAYDGTPPGACQLVSGTQGASDTAASGTSQPFIGGLLTRTTP